MKGLLDEASLNVSVEYVPLDAQEIGNSIHFAKRCGSVRPAICLARADKELVKLYPGVGTRHQSRHISSYVVTVRDLQCVAKLLAAIVDVGDKVLPALQFCAAGVKVFCKDQTPDRSRKAGEVVFEEPASEVPDHVNMIFVRGDENSWKPAQCTRCR